VSYKKLANSIIKPRGYLSSEYESNAKVVKSTYIEKYSNHSRFRYNNGYRVLCEEWDDVQCGCYRTDKS